LTLRRRLGVLCLCSPAITACALESADTDRVRRRGEAVVYGEDDRVDVYDAPEPFAGLASSAAVALIHRDRLRLGGDGTYTLDAPLLGDAFSLCAGERFADQPSVANCSGVLIAEDLVATSGHCLGWGSGNGVDCGQQRFVFGYELAAEGEPVVLSANEVYECSHVVTRVVSQAGARCGWDLAVVRLDRSVQTPRAPARFRAAVLETGEPLAVIGFPLGLPAKVDRGARVLDTRPDRDDYFTLNSDTFSVSSGSGVFDGAGQLVGLFARGEADFEQHGACQRVRRIDGDPATAFEEATTILAVRAALEAAIEGRELAACESDRCALDLCRSDTGTPDAGSGDAAAGEARSPEASGGSCAIVRDTAQPNAGWCALAIFLLGALRTRPRRRGCSDARAKQSRARVSSSVTEA
jgi:V8-like Glu-specific endopeptidase